MPYLSLAEGQTLFYTEEGSGDAVLLIHGWCCDGSDWAWLVSDLSRDHRCVMIDNRGHGRSSPAAGGYTPRLFAADAARAIEMLDLGRPVVIGHSMGTVIASALAVERPDLVRALVLVDPSYGADDAKLIPFLEAMRQAPRIVAIAMFRPDEDAAGPVPSARIYGDNTPFWLPMWHRRRVLGLDETVIRDALIGQYEGEEGIGRKVIGETYLRRRRAPTLAIYAGRGTATAEWDRTLDHGPLDEITIWPEHGHFLHQEDPERFAGEVRQWLERLRAHG
jgi:pimeloyl-ACP methyl ester carboxylesterase